MKKIGKISINPEKVIKNEELVNLRGGYCPECDDCDDEITICASQYYQAQQDFFANCGNGSHVIWTLIPGC